MDYARSLLLRERLVTMDVILLSRKPLEHETEYIFNIEPTGDVLHNKVKKC